MEVMNRTILFLLLVGSLAIIDACNDSDDPGKKAKFKQDTLILGYFRDNAITNYQQDNSGFYYYVIDSVTDPSAKTISDGQVLTINYTVAVVGGSVIESIDSVKLKQGAGAIFPTSLDPALALMKEGEEYGFVFPSNLAFGDFQFSTLIPSNSVLHYQVRLAEIQNDTELNQEESAEINDYVFQVKLDSNYLWADTSFLKRLPSGLICKTLSSGGALQPVQGDELTLHYTGRFLDSAQFDIRGIADPFIYNFGSNRTIPGFEEALTYMSIGERSLFIIPSRLAYQESAIVIPSLLTDEMVAMDILPTYASSIPPFHPLLFEIELISIN